MIDIVCKIGFVCRVYSRIALGTFLPSLTSMRAVVFMPAGLIGGLTHFDRVSFLARNRPDVVAHIVAPKTGQDSGRLACSLGQISHVFGQLERQSAVQVLEG